jgi:hypothetical protein
MVQHREQDLFLLLHVALEFTLHGLQVIGQAMRAFGPVRVDRLHPARQAHEFGKLLAVALVVARQQMVGQFAHRGVAPVALAGVGRVTQRREFAGHGLGVQAQRGRRFAQARPAAAAEVEPMAVEEGGRAGDAGGEVAEGTVQQGRIGHGLRLQCG